MGKLEARVADTSRRLAIDAVRSKAYVNHEESMNLRMKKVSSVTNPSTAECPGDATSKDQTISLFSVVDALAAPMKRGNIVEGMENMETIPETAPTGKVALTRDEKKAERALAMKKWNVALMNAQAAKENRQAPVALEVHSLKDAFHAIAATFDTDGDGTLSPDEVVHILNRCMFFDENVPMDKAKNFFKTWSLGCNNVLGTDAGQEEIDDGIGWEEFEVLLRWLSDLKGIDFATACARTIRLCKKACDSRSSHTRRLETVFDAFCKQTDGYMNVHEFTRMCNQLDLQQPGFATGDMFSIFAQVPNKKPEGMDFEGFEHIIGLMAEKRGVDPDAMAAEVAAGISRLETDEETIIKVKMKIKHAAAEASQGRDWREFFRSCDDDQSGCMDWDEFYHMSLNRLHLTERQNHLKFLFEKLDRDDSGELSIEELIAFMEH